jgi:hypothetical protein
MKSHFTFYHVLIVLPEARNKPTILADGRRHTPAVAMINPLVWFLESAVKEIKTSNAISPRGASFFIQGIIALQEQIIVVGNARWK